MTQRLGRRRLTLQWRARVALPHLLGQLLRRCWRAMFGAAPRITVVAAAVCAAWHVSALAAAPAVNTLPGGGVVTYGNATFSQTGNTLTINQSSNQAIANFATFSIGANAIVNINQPGTAASFLARVTGSDPSLLYGLLKSNGSVTLINQNGILVGPGGVVDVARFIASTLSMSDSDFLAGHLNFSSQGTVGDVNNQGTINSASGGSVYLIGANVSNSGVIHSPNGEILLAAGQTVQLVDTGTPGVSVNITGAAGNVTNLGSITAEAGSIGIAAGLINNSGNINASSAVRDGGQIFLRASQNLTTSASSRISADGAGQGGSIVLYAAGAAYIDGTVSVQGAPGRGGYLETSGKQSLNVIKLPTIGSGGTWYIDPYDLIVVSGDGDGTSNFAGIITSIGSEAAVSNATINGMLNEGTSVTLKTGNDGNSTGGNITIDAAIEKTSGTTASLTLDASNYININANITSNSTIGVLNLNLNSNYLGNNTGDHTVLVSGATIKLGALSGDMPSGGVLTVSDGSSVVGGGNLSLSNGAVLDLDSYGSVNAGTITLASGTSLVNNTSATVNLTGALNNSGTVTLFDSNLTASTLTNTGTLTLSNISGSLSTLNNNDGTLDLSNTASPFTLGTLNNINGGSVTLSGITSNLSLTTFNNNGTASVSGSSMAVNNQINNGGTLYIDGATLQTGNISSLGSLNIGEGGTLNVSGTATLASLQLSYGNFIGGLNSILSVTTSFTQNGGSIVSGGSVALNQAEGNLQVSNITAANLLLLAQNGNISEGSAPLHVTQQLITASKTGTTLDNSGNQIAAFAAHNSSAGDIVLVNNLNISDTSVVKLDGIINAGGNINVSNTGATQTSALGSSTGFLSSIPTIDDAVISASTLGLLTSGAIIASGAGSTVTIAAHSPLTIGSGGINANSNISLSAGVANSGLSVDNLTLNGQLTSAGGNIALVGGNSIAINANITTAAPGLVSASITPSYAAGVAITDASGTVIPVALPVVVTPPTTTTTSTVPNDASSQLDTSLAGNSTTGLSSLIIPSNSTSTAGASAATIGSNPVLDDTQTIGGASGTFGGPAEEQASTNGSSKSTPVKKLLICN